MYRGIANKPFMIPIMATLMTTFMVSAGPAQEALPVPPETTAPAAEQQVAEPAAVAVDKQQPAPPAAVAAADGPLQQLVAWMSGSFSSAAQAGAGEAFLDLRLHLQPIWPERSDGSWLYVEQATAEQQDQPYRQRVYQVSRIADNLFELRVFTLPDPGLYIGAWQQEAPLAELAPESLSEHEGCSILLRQYRGTFVGSTIARLCPCKLAGAAYATTEVAISRSRIESWDRGWDSNGHQVWGADQQPYLFDRIIQAPAAQPAEASDQPEQEAQLSEPAAAPEPAEPAEPVATPAPAEQDEPAEPVEPVEPAVGPEPAAAPEPAEPDEQPVPPGLSAPEVAPLPPAPAPEQAEPAAPAEPEQSPATGGDNEQGRSQI